MDESRIPNVRDYLDAHQFLQDIYKYKKKTDPGFSYESWAQELGVTSKSLLRFAVLGKRKISEGLASGLSKNLFEDESDRSHFMTLVLYTQSQTATQKKLLAQRLAENLRTAPQAMSPSKAISDPLHLMVRNYLSFDDAPRTLSSISEAFGISTLKIADVLNHLVQAELVESDNGEWKAKHRWIRVDGKPKDQELREYHNRSLEHAIAAQDIDPSLRTYRSLSFALDHDEYQELLKQISAFAQQVASQFDRDSIRGRRIYQLNLNLIPWSDKTVVSQEPEAKA